VTGFANQADVNLGRFTNSSLYFNGTVDEARIASGTRSSNWVWATWMTVVSNSTFSSYSAVNPRPTLSIISTPAGPTLTWPTNAGVFTLFSTTNLTPPATWAPATNVPVQTNGLWQVPLGSNTVGNQFFRLQQ